MSWIQSACRCAVVLALCSTAHAIGVRITTTSGGTLEDAILIASNGGFRDAVILGDLDLTLGGYVSSVAVDPGMTHWWLIGHQGSNVVYTSVQNLAGVNLYAVEPYTGAELAWNIPSNLDGYANSTLYSIDWWAQTVTNHLSHAAADGAQAGLWRFASPGASMGTVAVNLYSNEIPAATNGTLPSVPETGSTFGLLLGALAALAWLRRRN